MKTKIWLLIGAVLSVAGCNGRRDDAAKVSSADRDFVTAATQANFSESDLGRLAKKKAENTDVKRFGQHMINDHDVANAELGNLAGKKGIPVPKEADADQQKTAARLSELEGAAFDRRYMEVMVDDHLKAVALFELRSLQTGDAEIKAFAEKSLPMLRRHLTMARDVFSKVGGHTP